MQVNCATQEEVDYYWEKLSAGGDDKAQQCGEMISDPDPAKAGRAMEAMLKMKKLDIAGLKRAYAG